MTQESSCQGLVFTCLRARSILNAECSEFLRAESCGSRCQFEMVSTRKTAIVTGASQGIGAGLVRAFLDRGYNVVANSRAITSSGAFNASDRLALVDGSIAEAATAVKIAEAAKGNFGSIDALVNNAGMLISRSTSRITRSTICGPSFPSTSKASSLSASSRSSRCWPRRPAEAS